MPSAGNLAADDVVHVWEPAETVGEKENVGSPLGSDREGAEAINADRNARTGRQGQRKYGPARCLSRRPAHLTLEAISNSPSCADVHVNPPIKSLKHGECASGSKVAGGGGVAYACTIHDRMRSGT